MTNRQENKLSMFMVVRDYLNKNTAATATLPNFNGFFTQLADGIVNIHNIREQQELDKKGLAIGKQKVKSALITLALDISRKTLAYAEFVNDSQLFNEVNYSEHDLTRCADTILYDRARIIRDLADAHAAALLPYGVTAVNLVDLQTLLDAYNSAIPKPRIGVADKKQATDQLAAWIKQVDDALSHIDVLTEVVRLSQPLFYSGYQTARMIVDNGKGKMALKGIVLDAITQIGLPGANIIFTARHDTMLGGAEPRPVKKRSADKGGFFVRRMHRGSYDVSIEKPGYKTASFTVHITEGERCIFNASLEPVA